MTTLRQNDKHSMQDILNSLAPLPLFAPKKVTEHLHLRIRHIGDDIPQLQYRITSNLKDDKKTHDEVFKAVVAAAQKNKIMIVTSF